MHVCEYARDKDGYVIVEFVEDTNILDLAKDTFQHHIFPYLTFKDLINFAFTCKKAAKLFGKIYKLRIYHLERNYSLYDHQLKTISWMLRRESENHQGIYGGVVGLEMGLGKTLTSISLCLMKYKSSQAPTLIVTTKTVMSEWKQNIEKFYGNRLNVIYFHKDYLKNNIHLLTRKDLKKVHFVVTTYEYATSVCGKGFMERALGRDQHGRIIDVQVVDSPSSKQSKGENLLYTTRWERIITDESQRFNNSKTRCFKAMMNLCGRNRWCLSGTPIRNKETDMFSLMRFLGYTGCEKEKEWNQEKYHYDKLNKCVMFMTNAEAGIHLPEKKEITIRVDMSENEQLCYTEFSNAAKSSYNGMLVGQVQFANILALFVRLRQCCVAPCLTNTGEGEWISDLEGTAGLQSAKLKTILSILRKMPKNEKIIIFSTFTTALELVKKMIDKYFDSDVCVQVDGSTKGSQRDVKLEQFKSNKRTRILLMTYKTGSEGLNLTCANHVICIEPWWTPSVEDQAVARAWRNGQKKPVNIYRIIINNTIEDKMIEMSWEMKKNIRASFVSNAKIPKMDMFTMGKLLGVY